MNKYLHIILLFSALLCTSCIRVFIEEVEVDAVETESFLGDLVMSIDMPSADTKSISGDPLNRADSWSTWEKYCDGALLYRVTVFLVNADGTLVGYRNIYKASEDINSENGFYVDSAIDQNAENGVAVKVSFKQVQSGNYKVYAVANYSPITVDSNEYLGLGLASEDTDYNGYGGSLTSIIDQIILDFKASSTGIAGFASTENGEALLNYQLNSGNDRVCKIQPQALVMVRDITVGTGINSFSGKLSRTFARVRLTVTNEDEANMVGISNLAFNGAYASQRAYLFNDKSVGASSVSENHTDFALYESTKGTLTVSSENCIIPFSSTMRRLSPGASYNIFDCYILEGMIQADYAFSFTGSYWTSASTGGATANYMITSWTASGNSYGLLQFLVFVRNDTSNSNYLLEAVPIIDATGTVVTGGTMNVSSSAVDNAVDEATTSLDPKYVWEIQTDNYSTSSQVGVAYGQFYSIGYNLYLQAYDGSTDMTPKLAYSKSPSDIIFKINFSGQDEKGTIFCIYDGYYYYINKTTGLWTQGSSSTTSISNVSTYQLLTFETITGASGTQTNVTVQQQILSSSGSTGNNEIVRNDFFWGTIPIKVTQ